MLSLKILIAYFGEGLLMTYVGTGIIGVKLSQKKYLSIGMIYGLSIYLIRSAYTLLKIPFGTHTIILLTLLTLLFTFIGKISLLESAIAMFISEGLNVLGETIVLFPYINLAKITITEELLNSWYFVLMAYIAYIPMIIMSVLIKVKKFRMMNLTTNIENLN